MSEDMEATGGLDRRDFIKRGAVVGGLVWAAPLVQSLGSPAFAQNGTDEVIEVCENFYNFKIEGVQQGSIHFDATCSIGGGGPQCTPNHWDDNNPCVGGPGSWDPDTRTLSINFPHGSMSITFGVDYRSAQISLSEGCELLSGDAKAGSEQSGGGCFTFNADGSISGLPHAISNVVGTICCF